MSQQAMQQALTALNDLMNLERRSRVMPIGHEWDAARTAIATLEKELAPLAIQVSDDCQSCNGSGSGGMGVSCTDCLGTGRDQAAQPEFDRDADGELLIDWYPKEGRMFSLSLRADGRLSYAFQWDGERACGTVQMPAIEVNDAKDAARYRWLREQEWFSGTLCVLRDPKRVLTSGIGLGADCPSHHRLDAAIDAAMSTHQPVAAGVPAVRPMHDAKVERERFEAAYAAIPPITPTNETAWRIWNMARAYGLIAAAGVDVPGG